MTTRKKSIIVFVLLVVVPNIVSRAVEEWIGIQWRILILPTAVTLGRIAIEGRVSEGKSPLGWIMTLGDTAGSFIVVCVRQFIASGTVSPIDAVGLVVGLAPRWIIVRLVFLHELRQRRGEIDIDNA